MLDLVNNHSYRHRTMYAFQVQIVQFLSYSIYKERAAMQYSNDFY